MAMKPIITKRFGDIPISKHKSFEYQFEGGRFMQNHLFECHLNWSHKRDHAGISFMFGIYKLFWVMFKIYDHRHWDSANGCWENRDEIYKQNESQHNPSFRLWSDH
jgi:hypothetical protein